MYEFSGNIKGAESCFKVSLNCVKMVHFLWHFLKCCFSGSFVQSTNMNLTPLLSLTFICKKLRAFKFLKCAILNTQRTYCASINITKINMRFLFICIFRQYVLCATLWEMRVCWVFYNLYLKHFKKKVYYSKNTFFCFCFCRKCHTNTPEHN